MNTLVDIVYVVEKFPKAFDVNTEQLLKQADMLRRVGFGKVSFASYSLDLSAQAKLDAHCKAMGISPFELENIFEFYCGSTFVNYDIQGADLHKKATDDGLAYYDDSGRTIKEEIYQDSTGKVLKTIVGTMDADAPSLTILHSDTDCVERALWFSGEDYAEFVGPNAWYEYWINSIVTSCSSKVAFVVCDHGIDDALIRNRYAEKPLCTIGVIRGTLFKRPFQYGSPLNRSRGYLQRAYMYDGFVFYSEQERDDARSIYGPHRRFFAIPPLQDEYHKRLIPNLQSKRIAAYIPLYAKENVDLLLSAFSKALYRHRGAVLSVFGPKKVIDYIKAGTAKNGIPKNSLSFFPGVFPDEAFLSTCTSYVSVLPYSGFDLLSLKALSCGVPVVAFDYLYGSASLIETGENGFLVPCGDGEGLAQALQMVLGADRKNRKKLSKNARNRAGGYSASSVLSAWLDVIAFAIESSNARTNEPDGACSVITRMNLLEERVVRIDDVIDWQLLLRARVAHAADTGNAIQANRNPSHYILSIGEYSSGGADEYVFSEGEIIDSNDCVDYVRFKLTMPYSLFEQCSQGEKPLFIKADLGQGVSRYTIEYKDIYALPE